MADDNVGNATPPGSTQQIVVTHPPPNLPKPTIVAIHTSLPSGGQKAAIVTQAAQASSESTLAPVEREELLFLLNSSERIAENELKRIQGLNPGMSDREILAYLREAYTLRNIAWKNRHSPLQIPDPTPISTKPDLNPKLAIEITNPNNTPPTNDVRQYLHKAIMSYHRTISLLEEIKGKEQNPERIRSIDNQIQRYQLSKNLLETVETDFKNVKPSEYTAMQYLSDKSWALEQAQTAFNQEQDALRSAIQHKVRTADAVSYNMAMAQQNKSSISTELHKTNQQRVSLARVTAVASNSTIPSSSNTMGQNTTGEGGSQVGKITTGNNGQEGTKAHNGVSVYARRGAYTGQAAVVLEPQVGHVEPAAAPQPQPLPAANDNGILVAANDNAYARNDGNYGSGGTGTDGSLIKLGIDKGEDVVLEITSPKGGLVKGLITNPTVQAGAAGGAVGGLIEGGFDGFVEALEEGAPIPEALGRAAVGSVKGAAIGTIAGVITGPVPAMPVAFTAKRLSEIDGKEAKGELTKEQAAKDSTAVTVQGVVGIVGGGIAYGVIIQRTSKVMMSSPQPHIKAAATAAFIGSTAGMAARAGVDYTNGRMKERLEEMENRRVRAGLKRTVVERYNRISVRMAKDIDNNQIGETLRKDMNKLYTTREIARLSRIPRYENGQPTSVANNSSKTQLQSKQRI